MPIRYPGNIISATERTTTIGTASGVWGLTDAMQKRTAVTWPISNDLQDPYFNLTTLLLHGDGTNGANNTLFLDSSVSSFIPFSGTYSNYLNGSNYLSVASNSAFGLPGVFTVEFFINFASGNSFTAGTIMGVTSAGGFNVYYDGTRVTPNLFGTGNIFNSTFTSISPNTWYHIVIRRDSNNLMTMYVNGSSVGSTTTSTTYTTGAWNIYGSPSTSAYGYISNLRITNTDVYGGAPTVPTSPLTAVSGTVLLTCQSSTFTDNSINSRTITVSGNPMISAGGLPMVTSNGKPTQGPFSPYSQTGWSNYFNGSTDYLSGSTSALAIGTSDFTVEFWAYKSNAWSTSDQFIIDNSPSGGLQIWVNTTAGTLRLGRSATDFQIDYLYSSLTVNSWNHFAFVRSGTSMALFVNGTRVSTATSSASYASGGTQYIGKSSGVSGYWAGYISNLRVVNGTAVYNPSLTSVTVPTSPLTAITNTTLLTCQDNRFRDNSTFNYTLTPSGSTSVQSFSPFAPTIPYSTSTVGGSYYFSGAAADQIKIANTANTLTIGTSQYTIEHWIYQTTFPAAGSDTLNKNDSASFGYTFRIETTQKMVYYADGGPTLTSTSSILTNQWYHVAACYDGTTTRLFINGNLEASSTTASSLINDTGLLYLGTRQYNLGNPFYGYISDARITKRALYTSSFTPPTAPLTSVANTVLLLSGTNAGIFDQTDKINLVTYGNTAVTSSLAKLGSGSMYFDGSSYMTAPASAINLLPGDFTVEAWVNITTSGTNGPIMTIGSETTGRFICGFSSSRGLQVDLYGTTVALGGSYPLVTWTHVAYVRSGTTITGYINGISIGTTTSITGILGNTTGGITIGRDNSSTYFNGYIDELRVSRYARYTSNFTPPSNVFPNQ